MTKKEKLEEAKRLKAEINAKGGKKPEPELTEEERKLKRQKELNGRDRAKHKSGFIKKQLEAERKRFKYMDFDKW
jgi:hypothetical protein